MDNERRGEGDGAPVWMTVREEMLPVVVADIVVVVSCRVMSYRRLVDVVVVVEGGGGGGWGGEGRRRGRTFTGGHSQKATKNNSHRR